MSRSSSVLRPRPRPPGRRGRARPRRRAPAVRMNVRLYSVSARGSQRAALMTSPARGRWHVVAHLQRRAVAGDAGAEDHVAGHLLDGRGHTGVALHHLDVARHGPGRRLPTRRRGGCRPPRARPPPRTRRHAGRPAAPPGPPRASTRTPSPSTSVTSSAGASATAPHLAVPNGSGTATGRPLAGTTASRTPGSTGLRTAARPSWTAPITRSSPASVRTSSSNDRRVSNSVDRRSVPLRPSRLRRCRGGRHARSRLFPPGPSLPPQAETMVPMATTAHAARRTHDPAIGIVLPHHTPRHPPAADGSRRWPNALTLNPASAVTLCAMQMDFSHRMALRAPCRATSPPRAFNNATLRRIAASPGRTEQDRRLPGPERGAGGAGRRHAGARRPGGRCDHRARRRDRVTPGRR